MIFCTQIRRTTEPSRLAPVVVSVAEFDATFESPPTLGSPSSVVQLRFKVQADTNQDGTPDVGAVEWGQWEMDKIFYATTAQKSAVDQRLRGDGNLMQGIRTFMKARVRAHNEEQAPGGTQETYIDIDTDDPA
jgi:hypothetical protein